MARPLSNENVCFVSILCSFLATAPAPARRTLCLICPCWRRPRRFRVRRRGREIWGSPGDGIGKETGTGPRKISWDGTGSSKISWDGGRPVQQCGQPVEAEQGEAGAASGSCAVWSQEAERRRVVWGDLGKFLLEPPQISANLPSSTGWCHPQGHENLRAKPSGPIVPGRGSTRY